MRGYGGLTEFTEVARRYTNVVPVPVTAFFKGHTRTPSIVPQAYITYRASGTGNTGESTPGMVLYVPCRTQPCNPTTCTLWTQHQFMTAQNKYRA